MVAQYFSPFLTSQEPKRREGGGAPAKLLPLLKSGCACACGVRWPPEDHNSGKKRKSRARAMILLWHSPNKTKSRPHLNELANFAHGKSVFAPRMKVGPFRGCKIQALLATLRFPCNFSPRKCPADSLFLNLVEAVCAPRTPKLGQVTSSMCEFCTLSRSPSCWLHACVGWS
jgi:hypothetical protein